MQWSRVHAQSSTLLRLLQFIKSHGRGQLSRVNGTIKMQQALSIEINTKSDPFPNLLFFLENCGHRKAATDPRTQVQQLPSNKKWFHFSPRVCDFQPPCRSHAHLFERDKLHRTTGFLGKFIQSAGGKGGGGGEGREGRGMGERDGEVIKWALKKDWTGDKNKIRSTA